jgi:hypothetical protein
MRRDGLTFKEFIRSPWPNEKNIENPIIKWNEMNLHWLTVDNVGMKKIIIRNEDVIQSPTTVIDMVADIMKVTALPYKPIKNEAGPSQFRRRLNGDEFVRGDDILQRKCMALYSGDDIEHISSHLSKDVVSMLDYDEWCNVDYNYTAENDILKHGKTN